MQTESYQYVISQEKSANPSHRERKLKAYRIVEHRKWGPIAPIRSRWVKKSVLAVFFIALIIYLIPFDFNFESTDDYGQTYTWDANEIAENLQNISKRMEMRREHLENVCKSTGLNIRGNDTLHKPNTWEFLINKHRRLIWCNVFKAASTSWMYNFNILAGYSVSFLQKTKEVPLQLARKKYPRPSLKSLLQAQNVSTTFLIVRHPFERLLSGYRDKIEGALAHTYHQKMNNLIVLHYRKKGSMFTRRGDKIRRINKATFSEFVLYVIDTYKQGQPFDMHWAPINEFCTPCQIHFDIIMKFETLQEDQNYLIHSKQLERWIRPQWRNPSKGQKRTTNLIEKYYSQLNLDQINELYQIYKYDFLLFNYTLEPYIDYVENSVR